MKTYLFLLRGEDIDFGSYSPEDMQKLIAEFDAWNAGMIARGALILSASLDGRSGRVLKGGKMVKDGPYSEGKEGITGLFIIQAAADDVAEEMAAGCPFMDRGGSIEVRTIPALELEDAAGAVLAAHASKRKEAAS